MNEQDYLTTVQQATTYTYLTVNQFCEKHKAFKIGGVRSQIFNEDNNGLSNSGAIIRNGRKILIKEAAYFAWLEAKNGKVGAK